MHACRSSQILGRWTWVKLTSGAQLRYRLLGQVIDEKRVTLQLAGCISQVAIKHLAPLSMHEDLGTGVLLNPAFSGAHKRAEVLRNPCILGGPQRKGRVENEYWLPDHCLLKGLEEGGSATQPLRSRGSPTPSVGRKSEVATSPLPSRGPRRGRKCYVIPAFSGVPDAKRREKFRSGYLTPAFSAGQRGRKCYVTPAFSWVPNAKRGKKIKRAASPLPSRGPRRGRKCYITPAFSGIPNAKRRRNSEVATSPLPSWGPKRGRKCCVTSAFSGCPQRQVRREIHKWLLHPCILGGPQEGGSATQPLHSRGPQRQARGEIQKWLPHRGLLRGPGEGGRAM